MCIYKEDTNRRLQVKSTNMVNRRIGRAQRRPSSRLTPQAQRRLVEVEQRLLLGAVGAVQFPEPNDLAHGFHVEAVALGLGVDLADVGGQRRLLFFQALDALDKGAAP